jgi:hypothetical protein
MKPLLWVSKVSKNPSDLAFSTGVMSQGSDEGAVIEFEKGLDTVVEGKAFEMDEDP